MERGGERRKRDARTLALFRGGAPIADAEDVMLVATLSRLAVGRAASDATLSVEDASAAADAFAALAKLHTPPPHDSHLAGPKHLGRPEAEDGPDLLSYESMRVDWELV